MALAQKHILLISSGSVALQKAPALIKLLEEQGAIVRTLLTYNAQNLAAEYGLEFAHGTLVSPPENWVKADAISAAKNEGMPHIDLTRPPTDLILIAPATAHILHGTAQGMADSFVGNVLLARPKNLPLFFAPAMNTQMWDKPATQNTIAALKAEGARQIGPNAGDLACGEIGEGRMAEPEEIVAALMRFFAAPLKGKKALVTSGPTIEPLDPVRYFSNHSSGKQGHAIAAALAEAGADVTLISGPVSIPDPQGVKVIKVQTAEQMLHACEGTLPADIAVCAAAVADFKPQNTAAQKIKKQDGQAQMEVTLVQNPDILHILSTHKNRPTLVIGFAAETENLLHNARAKLHKKSCDAILANDVSANVFGADTNQVHLLTPDTQEDWGAMSKLDIARKLADYSANQINGNENG